MSNKCRQKGCPNTFTHALFADRVLVGGADCLPCFYAAQFIEHGLTPEQVEQQPDYMESLVPHLAKGGWLWSDVKASFERRPTLR